MLRISKLTDYATVILAALSERPGDFHSAPELSERTGIGLPTVSKLLKELQRAALVRSTRGARGGYQLARPAHEISAAEIIDAVEGPVALTECASDHGQCGLEASCSVGHSWQQVSLAIRRSLEEVRLTALIAHDVSVRPPDLRGSLTGGWRPLTRA
ncbi:MAG TPA: SUF system Fe-S cluster assembly regulator [Steroidobacteraceae bacterium]|jgi:FeS assembly SUF system regulator|nr:SUF system Fe-S cluster assembly regulator [Steroidobacteraceae bacterium]